MSKGRLTSRNLSGINTNRVGQPLNKGMQTYNSFDLVTSIKNVYNQNVRLSFTADAPNDYLSNYNHQPQFSTSAGSVLTEGVNYNNNFVARHGYFIAPERCYLKSIKGYINTRGMGSCGTAQDFYLTVWKKSVTVGGTTMTSMTQLFVQKFTFTGSANAYCELIDTSLDTNKRAGSSSWTVSEGEGVVVSIRRFYEGGGCGGSKGNINADFEMVFEGTEESTSSSRPEFKLPSISEAHGRYDNVLNSPSRDEALCGVLKKTSEDV